MKRFIIGTLVGAVIVFTWQSAAHMFMNHHDDAFKIVPSQNAVIDILSGLFTEEGQYLVPRTDLNASAEDMQKHDEAMMGKPWAMVTYHPKFESNMGMSALRGFCTAILCVMLFIWILGTNPGTISNVLLKGFALGLLMFLFIYYNSNIWMQTPWSVIKGELIDCLVAWGLCGLWLGWWLNRNSVKTY
jgi:hypothetical protein